MGTLARNDAAVVLSNEKFAHTNNAGVTVTAWVILERIEKPAYKIAGRWLAKDRSGRVLGMLERYNNTKTETHPWKAFAGVGTTSRFLGAFYIDGQVIPTADHTMGGKNAALSTILNA